MRSGTRNKVAAYPLVLALILLALVTGCGGGGGGSDDDGGVVTPVLPEPVLSVSAYPYTLPPPADDTELLQRFIQARERVLDAGATGQFLSYRWSELEPRVGQYDSVALGQFADAMAAAEQTGLTQLVGLQLINTVTREVPAELEATAWDDPAMIAAFQGLLDQLVPHMTGRVRYLSLGNEVDGYFGAGRMTELTAYAGFFQAARSYLAGPLPDTALGITITAGAWLGPDVQSWLDLTQSSDVIITTYYPLQADFTVRPPAAPAADFPALLALVPDKPWVLQEVGYPASPISQSSEALQAEFVRQVFSTWGQYQDRIRFLNFFLLHDFSSELVDSFMVYYGVNEPTFRAYLDSLGLRNADDTDKAAWPVLVEEAAAF
ncbi:MAG: hypothetical protein CML06_06430 [Pseudomonadales bacterium]|nr:hypothetical protein [Pseudomonadales bacterium]